MRFLHRHGFGIQSPWAYKLVTNVLFCKSNYYAFESLKHQFPKNQKRNKQLFRLVNALKPTDAVIITDEKNIYAAEAAKAYISAADKSIPVTTFNAVDEQSTPETLNQIFPFQRKISLLYFCSSNVPKSLLGWLNENHTDEKSILITDKNRLRKTSFWKQVLLEPSATSTFDLGSRGIVFFDPKRIKQNYKL